MLQHFVEEKVEIMLKSNARMSFEVPEYEAQSLLFTSKASTEPKPFDNIPDLGKAIAGLHTSKHFGKAASATSFLRQVLKGSRSCPEDLLREIIEVTRARAIERKLSESTEDLIGRVAKGIHSIQERKSRVVREKHGFSKKLADGINEATLRFSVNPPFAEVRMALTTNKRSAQVFVDKLALLEGEGQPSAIYKICYASDTDAVDLWKIIFEELTGTNGETDASNLDPETAAQRLENAEERNYLQVYRIPYYLCLSSAVIYNPESKDNCSGYILQLVEPGVSRPFEIRPHDIGYWRQMYYDLENGKFDLIGNGVSNSSERLNFSDYRKMLMNK